VPFAAASIWDTTLGILRDPIFAVILSLFLFFVSSNSGARFFRFLFGIAFIVALVWLVIKYQQVQDLVVAIVGAIGTVLGVALVCLAVIALAVILAVHAMHRRAEAAPMASGRTIVSRPHFVADEPGVPPSANEESSYQVLETHQRRLLLLWQNLEDLLGPLADRIEDDGFGRMIGGFTTAYFSGLRGRMTEVRRIHGDIADELAEMAATLPRFFNAIDGAKLRAMARDRRFLLSKSDLDEAAEEETSWFVYWLVRVLCVRTDWHTVATAGSKCWYGILLLQRCAEALER